MNSKTNLLLGLQLPKKIEVQEISDILFDFNQKIKINELGNIQKATLHKKNANQTEKTLLIISINYIDEPNFDKILKLLPQLKIYKHYLISYLSKATISDLVTLSFEQFNNLIDESKLIYFPTDMKPNCIIKAMYQHYFSLSGEIICYNGKIMHLEKGKYYARQLYCELFLDCIKTDDGYKIPADAIIQVSDDNLLPQFQNKQIILSVMEEKDSNSFADVMTYRYKIALN
ncbi:MAG: hypothetical protein Fur0028_14500 [Bacteroidales bacterium]